MRNLYAVLFVVATQTACAAFYAMEAPKAFGTSSFTHIRDY